jgi:hypothetical protein
MALVLVAVAVDLVAAADLVVGSVESVRWLDWPALVQSSRQLQTTTTTTRSSRRLSPALHYQTDFYASDMLKAFLESRGPVWIAAFFVRKSKVGRGRAIEPLRRSLSGHG